MKRVAISILLSSAIFSQIMVSSVLADEVRTEFLAGSDRYQTSYEISKKLYDKSSKVVIASGESVVDSISASVLAARLDVPLLLTKSNVLDTRFVQEIKRLNPKELIVVGGKKSVSDSILNGIKKMNTKNKINVIRIEGKNRSDTSYNVYNYLKENLGVSTVGLVGSNSYIDGLSAGSLLSRSKGAVVLLENNDHSKYKFNPNTAMVIFGGRNSLSDSVKDKFHAGRVSGNNRYDTSKEIYKKYFLNKNKNIVISSGINFVDALPAVTLANKLSTSVIFADDSKDIVEVKKDAKNIFYIGGALKNKILNMSREEFNRIVQDVKDKEKVVEFQDKNLLKLVNHNLDKNRADYDKVTRGDLENLKILNIEKGLDFVQSGNDYVFRPNKNFDNKDRHIITTKDLKEIKSLSGLEYASNLEAINLDNANIFDLTPLKNLSNLKYLSLDGNNIENLEPISQLKKLTHLSLFGNKISDVRYLGGLDNLVYLHLNKNGNKKEGLENISPLYRLVRLENLDVSSNDIANPNVINNFASLKTLDLSGNKITNFDGIKSKLIYMLQKKKNEGYNVDFSYQRAVVGNKQLARRIDNIVTFRNPFIGLKDIYSAIGEKCFDNFTLNIHSLSSVKEVDAPSITYNANDDSITINTNGEEVNRAAILREELQKYNNNTKVLFDEIKKELNLNPNNGKTFEQLLLEKISKDPRYKDGIDNLVRLYENPKLLENKRPKNINIEINAYHGDRNWIINLDI